jgi:hypothetical protein
MIKRTMIPALLGLALASHAVLAQDMVSPAIPGPERTSYEPMSDDQAREYWATHDTNAASYPFNP